eukprot:1689434-Pyramimonas_sp.AAC.1
MSARACGAAGPRSAAQSWLSPPSSWAPSASTSAPSAAVGVSNIVDVVWVVGLVVGVGCVGAVAK